MEHLTALISGLGEVEAVIFLIILIIVFMLGILMPIFVFTAQKWAYKSYKELVIVNDNLNQLIVDLGRISKNLKGQERVQ